MPEISNDNCEASGAASVSLIDGQAEAAILLVESLIHGLIERSIITASDAINIAETAVEAKVQIASDAGDRPQRVRDTLTILSSISTSIGHDVLR